MTRGRYYSVVMPIAAIVYVIVGILVGGMAWTIGALCIALVAVLGNAFLPSGGRNRNRHRDR